MIRSSPEDERLQAALIENMVREDLNPVDEARACAALVDDLGISKEELARRVGRSRAAISNLIRLLDLPDQVLELLERGELSEGHGRAILQVSRPGRAPASSPSRPPRRAGRCARPSGQHPAGAKRQEAQAGGEGGRISAEERAALADAEDALGAALGADVRVRRPATGSRPSSTSTTSASSQSLARSGCSAPQLESSPPRAISSVG